MPVGRWQREVAGRRIDGVAELATLQSRLLEHGRAPAAPFALAEDGSRPDQCVVTSTLAQLAERTAAHAIRSPALLILGDVATLVGSLAWFGAARLRRGAGVHDTGGAGRAARTRQTARQDGVLAALHQA